MRVGIIGMKHSGKSTLFDCLTRHITKTHERLGETHLGILTITDDRLEMLQKIFNAKKQIHPLFDIIDLPPLAFIKTSVESSVLSKIFEEVKNCDVLIQVVRQFTNPVVPPESGAINPLKEKSSLDSELILMDLIIVENRINRIERMKNKMKEAFHPNEPELLQRCRESLEHETPLSTVTLDAEREKILRGFQLLTLKPRITVININESEIPDTSEWESQFDIQFPAQKGLFTALSCRTEQELLELTEGEQDEFRKELGIEKPAHVRTAERLMDSAHLIRFLTGGENMVQSWIIPAGSNAHKAAGVVHTDMERGFIRAEVVTYDDFVRFGGFSDAKEDACLRLEGKEYIVKEGDVIHFRFNV